MSNASAVEALFFAALEKGTAAERAAYLDSACAGDADLRRQVEKLLEAHLRVGDFLSKPVLEQFAAAPGASDATQELGASTDCRKGSALALRQGGRSADEASDLTFLQPSTRPDSLGRLGHYEVLEVLGRGGFGIVLQAFDETLQRVVAIKVLNPQLAVSSPPRKRFLREARSSAQVRHDNVVRVYAVEEQPLPYLVMEFIPGETLQQRIDRTGPLETVEVVKIGRQIAEGLAAAHATGLIHRDIKPSNILIEAGPQRHVKITDFGLARAADDASLTQSGVVAGTPMFMAPEQACGETLDHRADLFSLGSVLYTMCSGRPPFRANSTVAVLKRVAEDTPRPIPEIIPEVPQWLCDLITRLHAKKREERFASAQEVADLLARRLPQMQRLGNEPTLPEVAPLARAQQPSVKDIPEAAPALRPRLRRRRWLAVAAVLLLLLVGGLSFTEATGVTNVRGTVIRLFSPDGTLVVEVDDPGVSVKIDGPDIVITGAGAREIRLKPGKYTVEAHKDGKVVSRKLVSVTKNGREVVRVSQEAAPDRKVAGEQKDPDRRAAEYALSVGGSVCVNDEDAERTAASLPRQAFRLTSFGGGYQNKKLTDAGLANFKGCKNLTSLSLWETEQVHDAGLAYFKDCKDLKSLFLVNIPVGDAAMAHFKGCKKLTRLVLAHVPVTDAGVAHFKDCKDLTELFLPGTGVSDAGLAHFKDCKGLTRLVLHHLPVSAGVVANFKDCKDLARLELGQTQVSDAELAHFKHWKKLTTLVLFSTQVSDAGLAQLAGCKNLKMLALKKTKVTAAGIDKLRQALPDCKIEWDGGVIDPMAGK